MVTTEAPKEWVTLYPRKIDLDNTEKLKSFENVTVVSRIEELRDAVNARMKALGIKA